MGFRNWAPPGAGPGISRSKPGDCASAEQPAWDTGGGARQRPPGTHDVEKCPEGILESVGKLVTGEKTLLNEKARRLLTLGTERKEGGWRER